MKELKCPKCGTVFTVDESEYIQLLSQVKNNEFQAEIDRRVVELRQQMQSEHQAKTIQADSQHQQALSAKDVTIQQKESKIRELEQQLHDIEALKQAEKQNAVLTEQQRLQSQLADKDQLIQQLKSANELAKTESELREQTLRKDYERQIQFEKEELARYKEMKARLSVKLVGETLEQHCSNEFERVRPYFPYAEFGKDNAVVEHTKGDFVFRDKSADGVEYISIMFEMKNESDDATNKHKNEDFLKKLDEDRRKKNCEFAVLVSMLEPENDLYNSGIVNKSHLYDKTYVIRPQFFIPLITLLCQTSRKSLDYKRELELAKQQSIDVTNFEAKIDAFKQGFGKNMEQAKKKYDEAIKQIDESIKHLQAVRDALTGSESYIDKADKKLNEELTIKKLTYGNHTMKALIEQGRTTDALPPSEE